MNVDDVKNYLVKEVKERVAIALDVIETYAPKIIQKHFATEGN